MFAFTYSAHSGPEAATAERAIMLQAKERYERERSTGRGLRGLDGAAQAGMIRRSLTTLSAAQRYAIEARFAILEPRLRVDAMRGLCQHVYRDSGIGAHAEQHLAITLIRRHYGERITLPDIARDLRVSERTVSRRWAEIRAEIRRLDDGAMARLEYWLTERGIVQPE